VISGTVAQAVSAEPGEESAAAFEIMASVLLMAVDVILLYVTCVVAAAVWVAARDLERCGTLKTSLPALGWPRPGTLVVSWVALAMSPAILVGYVASAISR
jgi:hypothetical protein